MRQSLNEITIKDINKVCFPVYTIPKTPELGFIDGKLLCNGRVLDDRNLPGETLGQRRVHLNPQTKAPIQYTINSIVELVKFRNNYNFIDNKGRPFVYNKSVNVTIKYKKIKRVDRKTTASVLYVEGCNHGITIPRPPIPTMKYAGIIFYKGAPVTLYEYSSEPLDDINRMI